MCFRPASATKAVECPNCKKKLATIAGIKQKICPFCKTPIPADTVNPRINPQIKE